MYVLALQERVVDSEVNNVVFDQTKYLNYYFPLAPASDGVMSLATRPVLVDSAVL